MIAGIIGFQVPTVGEWAADSLEKILVPFILFLSAILILVEKHEMMQSHWLASADSNIADFVRQIARTFWRQTYYCGRKPSRE